jgi:hypothetical protein
MVEKRDKNTQRVEKFKKALTKEITYTYTALCALLWPQKYSVKNKLKNSRFEFHSKSQTDIEHVKKGFFVLFQLSHFIYSDRKVILVFRENEEMNL